MTLTVGGRQLPPTGYGADVGDVFTAGLGGNLPNYMFSHLHESPLSRANTVPNPGHAQT